MEVRFGIESMHGDNRDYGIERYWKYARKGRIGSRINTDGLPKRPPKAHASGGVRGHVPPGKVFWFWLSKVLFPGFLSHSDRILISSIPLRWSLANRRIIWHLLRVPDTDDVKQKNKNHEAISSGFFPEQETKKSFVLHHLCPVHKVLTDYFISQFQLLEAFFN